MTLEIGVETESSSHYYYSSEAVIIILKNDTDIYE